MFTREGTQPTLDSVGSREKKKSERSERIRLLNSRSDLDLEIGIVSDVSKTLVFLT